MQGLLADSCPQMSHVETHSWRDFLAQRFGLSFSDSRWQRISPGLWQRACLQGSHSYADYLNYVAFRPEGKEDWPGLLESVVNHETGFFRHPPSFAALAERVLPALMKDAKNLSRPINLWSAGCSSGQEAYSLAMLVLETTGTQACSVQIWASDLSRRIVERARRGLYSAHEVRSLPASYRDKYLRQVGWGERAAFQIKDEVRALVRFANCNLIDPAGYGVPLQDVIFCQNVLIYFSSEYRAAVPRWLADHLNPGGSLFLGPSDLVEAPVPNLDRISLDEAVYYQRR
jgi:chemotaxis methyl-accepting protein methylase